MKKKHTLECVLQGVVNQLIILISELPKVQSGIYRLTLNCQNIEQRAAVIFNKMYTVK